MHRQRPRVPHHLLLVYPTSFSAYKGSGKSRQPKTKTQGDQEMCGHEKVHRSVCSTTGLWSSTEFRTDTPSFPGGTSSTEIACQYRRHKRPRFNPWVGKIPWRRTWHHIWLFFLFLPNLPTLLNIIFILYMDSFIILTYMFSCCSVTMSCLILCDLMDCSMLGFPVLHQFPEFAQIHVH